MKKRIFGFLLALLMLLCLVGCKGGKADVEALGKAKDIIYTMYKDAKELTPDDYQVVAHVAVDGVQYKIEWTIEVKSGNANDIKVVEKEGEKTTIDINKYAEEKIEYNLVATIKDAKGNVVSQSFAHYVPAFSLTSWEEFNAAEKGTAVNVKGIVTGAWKETDSTALVYFQNEDGGYYAYRLAITPESFATLVPGVEILVTGSKDIYSTVNEIVSGTFEVINSTPQEVAPLDITALFKAAEKISDKALVDKQGMFVTLKGVELLNIEDKYLWFQLGGKRAYIYLSSSTCFATAEEQQQLKDKMINGQTADITGFVSLYSGEIQILPLDGNCIVHVTEQLTDDEIIAKAEEKVLGYGVEAAYSANIDLATSIPQGATIAWTSGNPEILANDGKIVSYPLELTEIELTALITVGSKTKEVKVTVKIAAMTPSKSDAIKAACIANEGKAYMYEGVLIATDKSGYGFVADEKGVVYVRYKFTDFEIGDTVRVIGTPTVYTTKQYTMQFGGSITATKIEKEIKVMEPVLINGSDLAKPASQEEALANRYYGLLVKMTITVGYKQVGQYTNPYITYDDGSEGMYWYSAGKLTEFNEFDGKTITIVAPIYSYFTDGYDMWFLGTFVEASEGEATLLPTEGAKTIAEAQALADKEAVVVDGQVVNVTPGTGIVIADGTGFLFVYSGKNVDVSNLQIGDKVTVSGAMGTYNKARQIASPVITLKASGVYDAEIPTLTLDEINALDPDDVTIYGRLYKTTLTVAVSGSYVNAAEGNSLYLSAEDKEALAKLDGKAIEVVVLIYNYNSKASKFNLLANGATAVVK